MPSERILFNSPLMRIGHFACGPGERDWSVENVVSGALVVFPTVPVLIHQAQRDPVVADRNVVMYYNRAQPYRRALLHERGDEALWIALDDDLAGELVGRFRPSAADLPESPFDRSHGPSPAGCYLRHRALACHLAADGSADPLAVEETTIGLVAELLAADAEARGQKPRALRSDTLTSRREIAEEIRRLLAADPGFPWALDVLVEELCVSPGHLCRIFKAQTGVSIHQYLLQLRLREGAEAVLAGERDLSLLAIRLGFSSHSHFTESFRRTFGVPPSELREREVVDRLAVGSV